MSAPGSRVDAEEWGGSIVPFDALEPEWANPKRVHNWRNYITARVRALWPTFSPEQRMALATMADGLASREEWE